MLTFSESFHQAHRAHQNWQIDRPLIDKFNRSELNVALGLLSGEIDELNGGDETGIFTHENFAKNPAIKSDYRQQEISDIMVFAMTSFDEIGVEMDTEEIYARANAWADGYSFDIVEPDQTVFPLKALSTEADQTYELLKTKLNEQAAIIAAYEGGETSKVEKALENILVYCVAMHSLLGVDSGRAIMEKVARNMLKYPAYLFKLTQEQMLWSDDKLEELYDEQRGIGATEFDGPKMDIEVVKEDGEKKKIFDRPKTGTIKYFSPQEISNYEHNPEQVRQIGIWYRAAAQIIASTYGFSIKVSNLLSRK
jgi:hypothetical protein